MGCRRTVCPVLLSAVLAAGACHTLALCGEPEARSPQGPGLVLPLPTPLAAAADPGFPVVPAGQTEERPLPINLLSALQLANVRALDIAVAAERIRSATAALEGAQVLWLPTITLGGDYNRHDGKNQDTTGNVFNNSRGSGMLGIGTGIGSAAVLDVGQAIFAPLAARQRVRARQADLQTASNDTLVAVSDAYLNVQQARGELAGALDTSRRSQDLLNRTRKLAPNIVPELEVFRADTELARRQEAELTARERWQTASADLIRVLRLDPSAQVEPVEPPQLRIELIDLKKSIDELITVGLTYRPELAAQQAEVQATLTLLKQERLRPLIPSVLLRGFSTPVTGTLGAGYFGGGPNDSFGNGGLRSDFDLQVLWQLNNLGFGNRALVRQRQAENRLALIDLFRAQDRVAAEVAQAYAQAQQATRRVVAAEKGVRAATLSADKNLYALQMTKASGPNQQVTLVRPQEVVAAIQALAQAYVDFYGAVADANRAQFRLYRALGQPAQYLMQGEPLSNCSAPPDAGEPQRSCHFGVPYALPE